MPLYRKNDICWQAREYLARDKPNSALKMLSKKRSVITRQIMACAYGVLEDTNAVLEQWRKIANAKESIETTYADWFYMTEAVMDSAEFWKMIAQCARQNRFIYGVWQMSNSLWDKIIHSPDHRRINSRADLRRCNKRIFLLAQYHIVRINHDLKLANKLLKQYPRWSEIERFCK